MRRPVLGQILLVNVPEQEAKDRAPRSADTAAWPQKAECHTGPGARPRPTSGSRRCGPWVLWQAGRQSKQEPRLRPMARAPV